jgi:hypothetical protein
MSNFAEHEGDYRDGLSPEHRLRIVLQIWSEIRISGYTGATDWVVLEEIERAVTNAMNQDPPDVDRAESLTFRALHLIAGNIDS